MRSSFIHQTLLTGLAALLLIFGALPGAAAAAPNDSQDVSVSGGSLRWGIRESWRNYVGLGPGQPGPGAVGEMTATPPATISDENLTTWGDGEGALDLQAGTGSINYFGEMTLRGHPGSWYPNDGWGMVQTFSDPIVTLTGPTSATLSLVVTQVSVLQQWPTIEEPTRIDMVELTFAAADLQAGTVTSRSATLTSAGADLWDNYGVYVAGVQMDPVTFTVGEVELPEPTATTVALTATPVTAYVGDPVTFTARASVDVPGTFVFLRGSEILHEAATSDGAATFTTADLSAGTHSVVVQFLPDSSQLLRSESTPVTVAIDQPTVPQAVEGSLQWGVRQSFRTYVVGPIAHGTITPSRGATQAAGNGVFTFPQAASGTTWNGTSGTIQYAGQVRFSGHGGTMDTILANPQVRVTSASSAQLRVPFGASGQLITLATIDLSAANRTELAGGAVRYSQAPVILAPQGQQFFTDSTGTGGSSPFYAAGTEMDRITFVVGRASTQETITPDRPMPVPAPAPKPVAPVSAQAAAGSLRWGVSHQFSEYTTQKSGPSCPMPSRHCAGGSINTSGVGGGWLFPQGASPGWNPQTQTGTVQFSGVVTFRGYGQIMYQVANPRITVNNASSATLYTGYSGQYGPSSVPLDLAAATKTVDAGGAVTWSGVPVGGSLVGISAGQGIGFDTLTFTVGGVNDADFGATTEEGEETAYEAAATAPTTSGLDVITAADRITVGGRIQVRASGFAGDDEGILVVLYPGATGEGAPQVLDDSVTADADGNVTWAGMLPEAAEGEHVITLQGSESVGAVIDILPIEAKDAPVAMAEIEVLDGAPTEDVATAGPTPANTWQWWAAAGALVVIAACMSLLAARKVSRK